MYDTCYICGKQFWVNNEQLAYDPRFCAVCAVLSCEAILEIKELRDKFIHDGSISIFMSDGRNYKKYAEKLEAIIWPFLR